MAVFHFFAKYSLIEIIIALLSNVSFLIAEDPKKGSSGSFSDVPAPSGAETQDVAVLSATDGAICCVYPHPRDPMRRGKYCRFAYSLTVVHFRKVVIRQKIGSSRNGLPVIYRRVYMTAYYRISDICCGQYKQGNIQAGDRRRVVRSE